MSENVSPTKPVMRPSGAWLLVFAGWCVLAAVGLLVSGCLTGRGFWSAGVRVRGDVFDVCVSRMANDRSSWVESPDFSE